jgi:hypothetical protein
VGVRRGRRTARGGPLRTTPLRHPRAGGVRHLAGDPEERSYTTGAEEPEPIDEPQLIDEPGSVDEPGPVDDTTDTIIDTTTHDEDTEEKK